MRLVRSLIVDTLYVKAGGGADAVAHISAVRLQAALDELKKGQPPLSSPEVAACEMFIGWAKNGCGRRGH